MYILDANVIIDAHERYYPIDRFPVFWDWLAHKAKFGQVKMPREAFDEITPGDEVLKGWLGNAQDHLVLLDEAYLNVVTDILDLYAPDLTEVELENIDKDPFVIAAGRAQNAVVVTREYSKPNRSRGNRKIPDVCKQAGVRCIDDHRMIRELDFRVAWRPSA